MYTTWRPAETSLFAVLSVGDNEVIALSGVISDPVLVVGNNVIQSKDVVNTLGVITNWPIPIKVTDIIDGHSASVKSEV